MTELTRKTGRARPWWKRRRAWYPALMVFGLLGPDLCPGIPWEQARLTCSALSSAARLYVQLAAAQLGKAAPSSAGELEQGADGGV